ncbi:MAG TPA: orotidine-5'-phosphate decarboxylase [Saprospiraceae bacterium]|nr:orotidine-5'-phosphate decarboxylase [Saprospiraceae bacterium]MBK8886199.1 orotidine-5'-phosphate decarboxylase [Saprospiraceae bacterium]HQV66496.1 orotidine-5'-phosphate decarboxylase [Saprospiraceae bacterium]HQV96497.1 orotidine-5'-phosphate decarboxylase [Saprospiraceae bacterium]HRG41380.1 orotidine-5'-phosphate decarboxylase [Saprospiraceae bacterium]
MTKAELVNQIKAKKSFLCVGLDTDVTKIPPHLLQYDDPVYEFNKAVIEATSDLCVAYKPNIAFYESLGPKGWASLEKTMKIIPENIFTIADAKRGDIGNTSKMYAKTYFEYFDFDAVTVAPYMGSDSVTPFLEFTSKWVILLGLTSNEGSTDFQNISDKNGKTLYENVISKAQTWGSPDNLMFVIGATHAESFTSIRQLAKEYFFLVPGVGAQGGDLSSVINHGRNDEIGLLINSSREIIYAGNGLDFQEKIRAKAIDVSNKMRESADL